MYYRLLACLMTLSLMQGYADSASLAERGGGGGGGRGGEAHSEYHHPNYSHEGSGAYHPEANTRAHQDINRDERNNEFNRNEWNGANWGGGGVNPVVVPNGEYVYPGTTSGGDMNTLYDTESSNPTAPGN